MHRYPPSMALLEAATVRGVLRAAADLEQRLTGRARRHAPPGRLHPPAARVGERPASAEHSRAGVASGHEVPGGRRVRMSHGTVAAGAAR